MRWCGSGSIFWCHSADYSSREVLGIFQRLKSTRSCSYKDIESCAWQSDILIYLFLWLTMIQSKFRCPPRIRTSESADQSRISEVYPGKTMTKSEKKMTRLQVEITLTGVVTCFLLASSRVAARDAHRWVFWEKASCGALWLTVDAPLPSPARPSEIHPDWWWRNKADVLLSFYFYVFHFFILTRITLNLRFHFSGMVIKKETYRNKKKGENNAQLTVCRWKRRPTAWHLDVFTQQSVQWLLCKTVIAVRNGLMGKSKGPTRMEGTVLLVFNVNIEMDRNSIPRFVVTELHYIWFVDKLNPLPWWNELVESWRQREVWGALHLLKAAVLRKSIPVLW